MKKSMAFLIIWEIENKLKEVWSFAKSVGNTILNFNYFQIKVYQETFFIENKKRVDEITFYLLKF